MQIIILSQLFETHGTANLVRVLESRGHSVQLVRPLDCTVFVDGPDAGVIYEGRRIDGVDLALLRCAAHTRYGLTIVRAMEAAVASQIELGRTLCINSPAAKLRAHDKFLSLQILHRAGIPVPPTYLAWNPDEMETIVRERLDAPLILKTLEGSLGMGVMRADSPESAVSIHDALRSAERIVMAQQYIAAANRQDIRVIVVDGRAVGAFRRTARDGDFRSNIHRGGSAEAVELSPLYRDTAIAAARTLDLALAGVDLLETPGGPLVIEVNPSPGWKQLDLLTGIDVAGLIADYLERRISVTN